MKKLFALLIVCLIGVSVRALALGDFGNADLWQLNDPQKRRQTLSVQVPPQAAAPGLKIVWEAMGFRYAELQLKSPLPLPADFREGTISLQVYLPAYAPVRSVNLRLIDAKGEIFQYQMRCLPVAEAKLQTCNYQINLMQKNMASWGGNHDKIMDLPVSFAGISVDFANETESGEIYLAGLAVTPKISADADKIKLDLETGNPIHVLRPGQESQLKYTLSNPGSERFTGQAEAELTDYDGKAQKEPAVALDLAAGQSVTLPVTAKLNRLGHWEIRVKVTGPDGNAVTLRRSFAYFIPAGPTPGCAKGFLWGISSHPQLHPAEVQKLEALAAALVGAKVVREDVYWHRVQPARDRWDFRSFDQTVNIFADQGIELEAILCYCAPWAAKDPKAARREKSAPEPEAWRQFCYEMAKRYRDKVRFWEVWNEPDVTPFSDISPDVYAQMMLTAYRAVKDGNPDAKVLTGGFATLSDHPMLRNADYQEQSLVNGKGGFDIHAYHEHGPFYPHYVRMVEERFLPLRARTGTTAPWWPNETALTSAGGNEEAQALALYKKLIFSRANGAVGYNWYDLRNDGDDPNHGEQNYGMLTRDFYPKPVYTVYHTLVTVFDGKEYLCRLNAGPLDWLYVFDGPGEKILAAWSEDKTALPAIIRTDAQSAIAVDLMGNQQSMPIYDGKILLEVSNTPISLRLTNAAKVELAGKLIRTETPDTAIPGHPYRLGIKVVNPFSQPVEFQLKLRAPAGLQPPVIERTINLNADETKEIAFAFDVAEDFQPVFGSVFNMAADYRITGKCQGKIIIPVQSAQIITRGSFDNRAADFRLDRGSQIRLLFATDPTKGHLLWKGPQDLSGQVWLTSENGNLRLKIKVNDDIHCQTQHGEKTWLGDSVQFAVEVPGKPGLWELGLSRSADGSPEVWCWSAPDGCRPQAAAAAISLSTVRHDTETIYNATVPLSALGLTPEMLKEGFRFNLLINDNDGEGRESWINIAPGIGESKDPAKYPLIIFRDRQSGI